jgi:hypothetical protein
MASNVLEILIKMDDEFLEKLAATSGFKKY